MIKIKLIGIAFVIVTACLFHVIMETHVSVIKNCRILKLQQQQFIKTTNGEINTKIRYLIVTDKETFISESSYLNGKFNNSDIFYRLEEGNIYNLKVCGIGKSFFSDYRNVLEIL